MPLCLGNFQKGYGLFFRLICFRAHLLTSPGVVFFRAVWEMPGWMNLAFNAMVLGNESLPFAPMGGDLGEKEAEGGHLPGGRVRTFEPGLSPSCLVIFLVYGVTFFLCRLWGK